MRYFHTHSPHMDSKTDLLSIGRGQAVLPGDSSAFGNEYSKNRHKDVYSEKDRVSQTRKNLSTAMSFTESQKKALLEISETISLWKAEASMRKSRENLACLFQEPLIHLSNRRYLDQYLFDDGSTPPLKVHFSDKGLRGFIEIPILPLKSQHGFNALIASPALSEVNPSSEVFDLCTSEVIQLLLSADKTLNKLKERESKTGDGFNLRHFSANSRSRYRLSQPSLFVKILQAFGISSPFSQSSLRGLQS